MVIQRGPETPHLVFIVDSVFHTISPVGWDLTTVGGMALLLLVIIGAVQVLQLVAFSAAEALDPDRRDGDAVLAAAAIVRELREDINNGADTTTS